MPRAGSPRPALSIWRQLSSRPTKGEAEALDVLLKVVGGGATSRLYKKLVVEKQLASYAGGWYSGAGRDSGTIGVYAWPRTASGVEQGGSRASMPCSKTCKANGITADELERAKTSLPRRVHLRVATTRATLARALWLVAHRRPHAR